MLQNIYFELCVPIEQINITYFYYYLIILMKMELDLVLNWINSKLIMKMIETGGFPEVP